MQVRIDSVLNSWAYTYSSTKTNQSFHSASVGKVFTAICIMKTIEDGKLSLETPVHSILGEAMLENLFVYKGVDYQGEVTVEHLLSHTSGVNDYFEGKTLNKEPFLGKVFKDRSHVFTPKELVDFTRLNQKAVGKPGNGFLYSDTGYVLLGFILEAIHDLPYADLLKEMIYEPLGMKDTALAFHDDNFNQKSLAPLYFRGEEMSQAKSLSCDFSGGGLQTTTLDLSLFLHGLFGEYLISRESLEAMMAPRHGFHGIMRYGLGMIKVKLHRVVPWKIGYPPLYGGLGSLSVHAFYDPVNRDAYIINLGDASKMRKSFMILSKLMTAMRRRRKRLNRQSKTD